MNVARVVVVSSNHNAITRISNLASIHDMRMWYRERLARPFGRAYARSRDGHDIWNLLGGLNMPGVAIYKYYGARSHTWNCR